MSKTYIFAVGGTGARVMRALTMVLASGGGDIDSSFEFVPMIYDYDLKNGDKKRTVELMNKYKAIHDSAYNNTALTADRSKGAFFSGKLSMIREQSGRGANGTSRDITENSGFDVDMSKLVQKLDAGGKKVYQSLIDYISFDQLGTNTGTQATKDLVESIYSSDELNMTLEKGFKGSPNIGCAVIDKIETLAEFRHFQVVYNPGDKIVIVGSVFGGTGATCIPSILRMLRSDGRTQNAQIAIIAALPYFKVDNSDTSKIDEKTYTAKTKAAIAAYQDMVYPKVNAIYYLGDNHAQNSFANHEGDDAQRNDAALCELEGAMDILHFAKLKNDFFQNRHQCVAFEFGYNTEDVNVPQCVNYKHFMRDANINGNPCPQDEVIDALNRLALFSKFNQLELQNPSGHCTVANWYQGHLDNPSAIVNVLKAGLIDFAEKQFDWIDELQGTHTPRKLNLFNDNLRRTTDFTNLLAEPYNNLCRRPRLKRHYPEVECYGKEFVDRNSIVDMMSEEYGEQRSTTDIRQRYLANNAGTVADVNIPAFYIELSTIVWRKIYDAIRAFSANKKKNSNNE